MPKPRLWDRWEPAEKCSGGPQPGAVALMQWVLDTYPEAENWGIYSCRSVWDGGPLSVHAEGRAIDVGLRKPGARWGKRLADDLVWKSRELGIQCVIYRRRQWAGDHWDKGWRPYIGEGPDPHETHLHIELSRWTARTLTRERIEKVMRPPHAQAAERRQHGERIVFSRSAAVNASAGVSVFACTRHFLDVECWAGVAGVGAGPLVGAGGVGVGAGVVARGQGTASE